MDLHLEAEARRLGLGRLVELFPDDVEAAARRVERQRQELDPPRDVACEPWPPMRCADDARP